VNKIFVLLGFGIALWSCSGAPRMEGHWVSVEYLYGEPYETLDFFGDSVVIQNKRCIPCRAGQLLLIKTSNLQYQYGYDRDTSWISLVLDGDTITRTFVQAEGHSKKFFKRSMDRESQLDLFYSLAVRIDLKSTKEVDTIQIDESVTADMNVGYASEAFYNFELSDRLDDRDTTVLITPDATTIEVDDVFISQYQIPIWIARLESTIGTSKKNQMVIRLNLSKDTPPVFRENIIKQINSVSGSLRIVETFYNEKIGAPVFLPIN
jgi:hypothetical protein